MARIDTGSMRVEHWYPQAKCTGAKDLAWDNLLDACNGSESAGEHYHHCDGSKHDTVITITPLKNHPKLLMYTNSGRVEIDDPTMQSEIDDVLRLNIENLREARKEARDTVFSFLAKKHSGTWSRAVVSREIEKLEELKIPFVEYVVFFLRKKL